MEEATGMLRMASWSYSCTIYMCECMRVSVGLCVWLSICECVFRTGDRIKVYLRQKSHYLEFQGKFPRSSTICLFSFLPKTLDLMNGF